MINISYVLIHVFLRERVREKDRSAAIYLAWIILKINITLFSFSFSFSFFTFFFFFFFTFFFFF